MTQSTPDVMQAVKQEAPQYLGDVSRMSDDQIKDRIRNLANTKPDTARQMVDSVCSALDRGTGGRFKGQIDQLQQIVFDRLGLDPSALGASRSGTQSGAATSGRQGQAASGKRGAGGQSYDASSSDAPQEFGASQEGTTQRGTTQGRPSRSGDPTRSRGSDDPSQSWGH